MFSSRYVFIESITDNLEVKFDIILCCSSVFSFKKFFNLSSSVVFLAKFFFVSKRCLILIFDIFSLINVLYIVILESSSSVIIALLVIVWFDDVDSSNTTSIDPCDALFEMLAVFSPVFFNSSFSKYKLSYAFIILVKIS